MHLTSMTNWNRALKQDESPLLREVALGFIVIMVKDMREQMRGAAYTALKEVDSDDIIPYFEDGLSDGSGPVRASPSKGSADPRWGGNQRNYTQRSKIKQDW